jgi:hypothetical protein
LFHQRWPGSLDQQGVQVLAETVDEFQAAPHDAEIISSRDTGTVGEQIRPVVQSGAVIMDRIFDANEDS